MPQKQDTPSRLIYMSALLDVLRVCGGSAVSKDIYNTLIEHGIARAEDRNSIQLSGESRFVKEVRFARKELVDAGLLLNGVGGLWSLSPQGWATQLSPDEARDIIKRRRHGPLINTQSQTLRPSSGNAPTVGPAPSTWTKVISRRSDCDAWTYVMRYGSSDVWKIGFASNVDARLQEINTHVPVEITGMHWNHFARCPWASAHLAFEMEQRLLALLKDVRTAGERVRCSESKLLAAWRSVAKDFARP